LLARNLGKSSSLVSLSGIRVKARCEKQRLTVALSRSDGSVLPDDTRLALATTDFLATGGDAFFADAKITFVTGPSIRDELASALRRRGGSITPDDPTLLDPAHPRFDLPGPIPIRCE
jgi:hypothetical protein